MTKKPEGRKGKNMFGSRKGKAPKGYKGENKFGEGRRGKHLEGYEGTNYNDPEQIKKKRDQKFPGPETGKW